ncbi:hypothetical protein [Mucilaginibacter sp.]|uniref:hypothetical protein n=1 Tax=Mucilaginibacter sp. TaxID=1882438 RepID=UPI00260D6DA5|nr:hypothetical protein [Mucilaginibacter sp.]MDB4919671.1 hypothetical protein [Mucilaginibacter sp.]
MNSLQINFDAMGLNNIMNAGYSVLIFNLIDGGTPVVWAAFQPMMSNQVQWDDNASVYSSQSMVIQGSMVSVYGMQSASPQNMYTWTDGGQFSVSPASQLSGSQYGVTNNSHSMGNLTFGLAKPVYTNGQDGGATPVNIQSLMANSMAVFGYTNKIYVCLGQNYQAGVVVQQLPPTAGCTVDFSTSNDLTVFFNDATSTFMQQ